MRMDANGGPRGARLVADVAYERGQVIHRIVPGALSSRPDRWTIQIGSGLHITDPAISSMNHSCDPNTVVDTAKLLVIALREIAPGDELTFFYPSTEWAMARPFACLCGASECLGYIAGARYLSASALEGYFVNPHIRAMLLARGEGAALLSPETAAALEAPALD